MALLSLTVADVGELNNGCGVGQGHDPVAAGDGFPCRTVFYYQKIQPASFGFFLLFLFTIPVSLFAKLVYLFALYYSLIGFSQDAVKTSLIQCLLFLPSFLPLSYFANCWEHDMT